MRGHLRKRSKNSWTIVLSLGRNPQTGKKHQRWVSVKGTRKDAEKRLAELLHQIDTGSFVTPAKCTIGELLEQWLRDYIAINSSLRTYERCAEIVQKHLVTAFGSTRLASLQPHHLQSYYTQALKTGRRDGKGGLSALTVLCHHRVIFQALKYDVKHGMIVRDVAEAVDPPRSKYKEMSTTNAEGINRLLEALKGNPYYVIFYTAAHTGLRRSELLALR